MANPSIYKIINVKQHENTFAKDEISASEQTQVTDTITKFISHFKHQHL